MWQYQKTLQYPINITNPNPLYAKIISSQLGGPDGELGASLRYLNQRFAMPKPELQGLLTDIGTEELGHMEMIGTLMYQLTRGMTEEQIKRAGFESYFVDHTAGVYPASAEQKARTTYDNILRLVDDPEVTDVIRFLREREIVHFQRFGEGLRLLTDELNRQNFYAFNPSFDK